MENPNKILSSLSVAESDVLLDFVARLTPQWLAGFFDGEGCVCGLYSNGYPYLTVTIPQKEPGILAIIALKFPTKVRYVSQNKNHVLHYAGRKALPLLEFIKDYSIVKRKEIELGIELASLLVDSRSNDNILRSEESLERRTAIVEELRSLKR